MALPGKTENSHVPDLGQVNINITADAIAAFTAEGITNIVTAEVINISGTVRSMKNTTVASRTQTDTKVTGDTSPIVSTPKSKSSEQWTLIIVDDKMSGKAGEWGTDGLTCVEIVQAYDKANYPIDISVSPDGDDPGKYEIILQPDTKILSVEAGMADADMTAPATRTIVMACPTHEEVVHA